MSGNINKILNIIAKNRVIGSIFLTNILFLAIFNLLFYPRFSNEADIVMQSIVYGTNQLGLPLSRILFSNVILGKIIMTLFLIFPKIAWYTVAHYLAIFMSLVVISYITYKRNPSTLGWIIVVVIETFFGYECYVTPTYLKTAAIMCVAGWTVFIYALESKKIKFFKFEVAVILFGISSMFSFKMFLITTIVNGIIVAIYICLRKLYKGNIKQIFLVLLISVSVTSVFYIVDKYAYLSDSNWTEAYEIRGDYEKAFSYGVADYDEEFVEKINREYARELSDDESIVLIKNEAGYRWLSSGRFLGKNELTNQVFHKVVSQHEKMSFETLDKFFKTVPLQMFSVGMLYLWIILILIMCFHQENKDKKIICWSSLALFLIVLYIFYIKNNLNFIWVKSVVLFPICGGILSTIKDARNRENRVLIVYLMVLSVILYNKFSGGLVVSINQNDMKEQYEQTSDIVYENLLGYENGVTDFFFEDLNQYLSEFSAFKPFDSEVSVSSNIYNVNGVYWLIPDNESSIYNYVIDDALVYGWVVNGKGINEHDLVVFH